MKRPIGTEAELEALLRSTAQEQQRRVQLSFVDEINAAIDRETHAHAHQIHPATATWRRLALAAAIVVVASLAATTLLMNDSATLKTVEATNDAVEPGPAAMLASLQRTPAEWGSAARNAMDREINQFIDEAWREQQMFLARLPLRGRIDRSLGDEDVVETR